MVYPMCHQATGGTSTMSSRYFCHAIGLGAVLCFGLTAGQPDPWSPNAEGSQLSNIARIPAGAETKTIRFEKVRRVEARDGSGMVYEVTYSYMGQPLASDDRGDRRFTFKVYFWPDDLTAELQETLAARKAKRADSAACFSVSTAEDPEAAGTLMVTVDPVPERPAPSGVSATR